MKIIRLDSIVHELERTVSLVRLGMALIFRILPVSVFFRNDLKRDHFSYHVGHKLASLLPSHGKPPMRHGTQKAVSCAGLSFQTCMGKGHFSLQDFGAPCSLVEGLLTLCRSP